jgi:hypothetical protein
MYLDPPAEPGPGVEQRLVGDLDGRISGDRVAVEGEQPVVTEPVEDVRQLDRVEVEPAQVAVARRRTSAVPSPGVTRRRKTCSARYRWRGASSA